MSNWTVVKLGGTSQCVSGYIKLKTMINHKADTKFVVVLSAVNGITNLLEKFTQTKNMDIVKHVIDKNNEFCESLGLNIKTGRYYHIIEELINECNNYVKLSLSDVSKCDIYLQSKIIGYGEIIATKILHDYFKYFNVQCTLIDSYKIIKSKKETFKLYPTSEFYCDKEQFDTNINEERRIYITQGFIASSPSNKTILLGRGGSDTTGALYANMLDAAEYIVYTDVDGIFTTDPRICENAKLINEVDYNIVQELSAMGAKVMHPYSIMPCMIKNIPIIIRNTFTHDTKQCTTITHVTKPVYAIALQRNVKLFRITLDSMWSGYGFIYDIFRRFSERRIDVNIISTSQFTVSTTCDERDMILVKDLIQDLEEKYIVEFIDNCSIVSVVTNNITETYKHIDFTQIPHHLLHIGATNNSISFVVDNDKSNEIVCKLHSLI